MIIDLILDRKDGSPYDANKFYHSIRDYERDGLGVSNDNISIAMDYYKNKDVQNALCEYVRDNGYHDNIQNYIRSQKWI